MRGCRHRDLMIRAGAVGSTGECTYQHVVVARVVVMVVLVVLAQLDGVMTYTNRVSLGQLSQLQSPSPIGSYQPATPVSPTSSRSSHHTGYHHKHNALSGDCGRCGLRARGDPRGRRPWVPTGWCKVVSLCMFKGPVSLC